MDYPTYESLSLEDKCEVMAKLSAFACKGLLPKNENDIEWKERFVKAHDSLREELKQAFVEACDKAVAKQYN
jgi:hypothetical protein